ncbi:MAG: hypothetical protein KGI59_02595 [Patescibacteria group bacterium]|nr:hypothetical protein [Patescibacteria group bacterium]MDE2172460.1 hypothetical protein [Patescibacteria group bacterium]
MYTLIILFYLAFAGIVAMLLLKRHEISSGHATVVSRLGKRSDEMFLTIFASVKRAISYLNRRTFIHIAEWLAYHVLYHVRAVYVEIKARALQNPHSKKVIDAVRGRADVNPAGASFYLKRIADK